MATRQAKGTSSVIKKVEAEKAPVEKKESTEVAKVENTALANVPEFMDASDFGGGFEGADAESFAIPFLQILQKMSPMVDEDDGAYVEGAKAGMLINTVTKKLYDGKAGLIVIPCAYKRTFILWGGREGDGGFQGEFTVEQFEALKSDPAQVMTIEGRSYKPEQDGSVNEKKSSYYADTRSHFLITIDPDTNETGRVILSLAATQTKASKMLMTALQQKKIEVQGVKRTPPTFANLVKLTTVGMSNDKGSWSGAQFALDGLVTDAELYKEAKSFHNDIVAGNVQVDHNKSGHVETGNATDTPKEAEGF